MVEAYALHCMSRWGDCPQVTTGSQWMRSLSCQPQVLFWNRTRSGAGDKQLGTASQHGSYSRDS
jgi:hypothetical protein